MTIERDALTELDRRVEVHRALGDPLRLAIVDALLLSDLTPSEVEQRFEVPSNLLAHHVGILESAGLVRRSRSQGDGRRRYLSVRRDTLTAAGIGEAASGATSFEASRVVFVCTRNSARSPLASALWSAERTDVPSTSAGTHPAEVVHPLAITAGRQAGLGLRHRPQTLEGLTQQGDLVVTVCDQAHEERAGTLHWSIPDPVRDGRPEAFEDAVRLLRERVTQLAHHVALAS